MASESARGARIGTPEHVTPTRPSLNRCSAGARTEFPHPDAYARGSRGLHEGDSGRLADVGALEPDDGRMRPAVKMRDNQTQSAAPLTQNGHDGCGARGLSRIPRARFGTRHLIGGRAVKIHLVRRSAAQRLMRSMLAIPLDIARELGAHGADAERNQYAAQTFVLERTNEPFDDGNTAMPADGAETRLDAVASAPVAVRLPKLGPLVQDGVLRSAAGVGDDLIQGTADLLGHGGLRKTSQPTMRREKWSTTSKIHQQKGQDWASAQGSHGIQKPDPMGMAVRSKPHTWPTYLDVTVRRGLGLTAPAAGSSCAANAESAVEPAQPGAGSADGGPDRIAEAPGRWGSAGVVGGAGTAGRLIMLPTVLVAR